MAQYIPICNHNIYYYCPSSVKVSGDAGIRLLKIAEFPFMRSIYIQAFCWHSLIKGLWWVPFRFLCIASPDLSLARKSLEVSQLVQDVGDKLSLCIRPMVMYRIFNSTHVRLCPVIIFCLHQGATVYISFKLRNMILQSKCEYLLKNVTIVNSLKGGIQSINPLFHIHLYKQCLLSQ